MSYLPIILCLLALSSADNLGKQFRPKSDPIKCWASFRYKLFDMLKAFLKDFIESYNFEEEKHTQAGDKKHAKITSVQRAKVRLYRFLIFASLLTFISLDCFR